MKEALLWKKIKDNIVQCKLCPHFCTINPNERGKCGVRENKDGVLYALTYNKPISMAVDPIEKKPLYHVMPGSLSYSVACVGCNLSCKFCQNSDISQSPKQGREVQGYNIKPEQIIDDAIDNGCKSIAYTYTEPTIFFEFCLETAKLAKQKGLLNVFVSNGFTSEEAIEIIAPYLDAINIDLKSFSEDFYKEQCDARLMPVLTSIKHYHKLGILIEITTLIIPGLNDSKKELKQIADFIASVDPSIPWHISRFYPHYKMPDTKPTPISTIHKAIELGKRAGLKYIYPGNVPDEGLDDTICPSCSKVLVKREYYTVKENNIKQGKCGFCNAEADFITS